MLLLLVFLPFFASVISGLFGRFFSDRFSHVITCGCVSVSAILAWIVFFQVTSEHLSYQIHILPWIIVNGLVSHWSIQVNVLVAIMLVVVTTISCLVHIYSVGYMSHDKSQSRFMSYLSFFTFAMLILVTADNLIQLFCGWEGVGLASYLLIGFWYEKPSACAASIKAFIVNRIGDVGFALGIFTIFILTGSVEFDHIFSLVPTLQNQMIIFLGVPFHALTTVTLLLFIGAVGKSAQLGLHTWLPDAMEGPTPVSALIHAATMVTAGVFMICRLSPIFEYAPVTLNIITIVGATTAFFAATVAITQYDIKRIIAYSTCSQLGYMFSAIGVSAYPAAMFHLATHAFFKALLFLGAGSVIHAMSDEQDIRKMGGIFRLIPSSYIMMWIGSLALSGIGIPELFGFSGFYSKDSILESAYAANTFSGTYAYVMGTFSAFLTALYSGRLLFLTFHGKSRASEVVLARVHESPKIMLWPLYVLAFGAVFSGFIWYDDFVGHSYSLFWSHSIFILPSHAAISKVDQIPLWSKLLPVLFGIFGLIMSYVLYISNRTVVAFITHVFRPVYVLFFNKWYFDELYNFLFVRPSWYLSKFFWNEVDRGTIDYFGPNGVSSRVLDFSRLFSWIQTGYLYHYAFSMIIGLVIFVMWFIFVGQA